MKKHQHTSTEGKPDEMTVHYGNYPVANMHRHYVDVLLNGRGIVRLFAEERNSPLEEEKAATAEKLCKAWNEYDELKAEVERLKRNKETAMLLALEFGYKQCEKGENLDGAFLNYNKVTQP